MALGQKKRKRPPIRWEGRKTTTSPDGNRPCLSVGTAGTETTAGGATWGLRDVGVGVCPSGRGYVYTKE